MEQIGEEKRRRREGRKEEEERRGKRKRKKKGSKRRAKARNQNVPSTQSSIPPRAQHIGIMPAREILLLDRCLNVTNNTFIFVMARPLPNS